MAKAFVDNPKGYTVVNHIDENKTNNNAENLEWCTQEYNRNYGHAEINRLKSFMASKDYHNIKHSSVIQYDKQGNEIKRFFTIADAIKEGYNGGCIVNCYKGRRKTHKGYVWRYEEKTEM